MERDYWLWSAIIAILSAEVQTYLLQSCSTKPKCNVHTPGKIEQLKCRGINFQKLHSANLTQDNCNYNSLHDLTLINCNIQHLEERIFYKFTELRRLNLSNNLLQSLNFKVFFNLRKVEEIDLSLNSINVLLDDLLFSHQKNLRRLNLSRNNLTRLSPALFSPIKGIETIDLSYNKLTSIPDYLLISQENLKSVNLCCNELVELSSQLFINLLNLQVINLSFNNLIALPNHLFISQGKLKNLFLGGNKLERINVDLFHQLKSIKNLDLTSNNFICDCGLFNVMSWCKERKLTTDITCLHSVLEAEISWTQLTGENCENLASEGTNSTNEYPISTQNEVQSTSGNHIQVSLILGLIFMVLQTLCCSVIGILYLRKRFSSSKSVGNVELVNSESRPANAYPYDYILPTLCNDNNHIDLPDLPPRPFKDVVQEVANQTVQNAYVTYGDMRYDVVTEPYDSVSLNDSRVTSLDYLSSMSYVLPETEITQNSRNAVTSEENKHVECQSNFGSSEKTSEGILTPAMSKQDEYDIPELEKRDDDVVPSCSFVGNEDSEEKTVAEIDSEFFKRISLYCE